MKDPITLNMYVTEIRSHSFKFFQKMNTQFFLKQIANDSLFKLKKKIAVCELVLI